MLSSKNSQSIKKQRKPLTVNVGLGIALGVAMGAAMDNIALGITIGIVIGSISTIIQQRRKS